MLQTKQNDYEHTQTHTHTSSSLPELLIAAKNPLLSSSLFIEHPCSKLYISLTTVQWIIDIILIGDNISSQQLCVQGNTELLISSEIFSFLSNLDID